MPPTATAVREELTGRVRDLAHASSEPSVKGRLRSLARIIGMPTGRIEKYWYGLVLRPPAHEADLIRAYHSAAQELLRARKAHEEHLADFLRNHSRLAFLVPGPSQNQKAAPAQTSFVAHKAKKKRHDSAAS